MLVLSIFKCRKHTFVLRILSPEESAMLVRFLVVVFWCVSVFPWRGNKYFLIFFQFWISLCLRL